MLRLRNCVDKMKCDSILYCIYEAEVDLCYLVLSIFLANSYFFILKTITYNRQL